MKIKEKIFRGFLLMLFVNPLYAGGNFDEMTRGINWNQFDTKKYTAPTIPTPDSIKEKLNEEAATDAAKSYVLEQIPGMNVVFEFNTAKGMTLQMQNATRYPIYYEGGEVPHGGYKRPPLPIIHPMHYDEFSTRDRGDSVFTGAEAKMRFTYGTTGSFVLWSNVPAVGSNDCAIQNHNMDVNPTEIYTVYGVSDTPTCRVVVIDKKILERYLNGKGKQSDSYPAM